MPIPSKNSNYKYYKHKMGSMKSSQYYFSGLFNKSKF